MANRIKGITVEIGGDTTGLDKALKSVNTSIRSTQSALKDVNRLLKLDPSNTELLSQKQKLLKDAIAATKEKLDSLKVAQEQAKQQLENGELGQDKYDALQREIVETEEELRRLQQEAATTNTALSKIDVAGQKMETIGNSIAGAGKKMMSVTTVIGGVGVAAVKTAADFDSAMSQVAAVSGATGKDFDTLRNKAREMGAKTKFSATEAAEAMNYMAMAGWKTEDMLDGIEGVMNLAAASGEDLATTSDIVTDALTAFGLSAKDSGHFADILAAASSNANTNVSMMGETFKYCAPIAGALGFSAEDTAEAIGLMANAGIKSSQAGTALRTIMNNLAGDVKISGKAIGDITIATTNADGSMRDLSDILADCRSAFGNLTESEKAQAAESLVGKNAMSGFLALMNAGQGDIDKLSSAIDNCDGSAEKMAMTMQNNLAGQLTILKSQLQELAISFGDILMPAIRSIVSNLQGFVDKLNGMDEGTKRTIVTIALLVASIGPLLVIIGTAISKIGVAMQGFVKLANGISKLKIAIQGGTGVLGKLGAALGGISAPVLAVVAVIAVLVAAFVHLWKTNEGFRDAIIGTWNRIKDTISGFCQGIVDRLNALGFQFTDIVDVLKTVWDGFCQVLAPIFEGVFNNIANILSTVTGVITGILDVFIGIFTGNWSQAWNGVKDIFSSIWNGISSFFTNILNVIKGVADVVLGWFGTSWNEVWTNIKTFFEGIWNGIATFFTTIWETLKNVVTVGIMAIGSILSAAFDIITLPFRFMNIPVLFEKESINTMDAKGEVLITIMASLAQQESQSLSQNVKMGLQYRYQQGKVQINHNRFLGYTKDADGNLVIDPEQAETVKRIYREYLEGLSMDKIAAGLERDGILTGAGGKKWHTSTINKILRNEKYIGDALLQKTYTTDFLNKTRVKNNGLVPQYYVEGDHEAIIPKDIYLQVQEELVRRRVVKTSANGKKRSYSCNHCFSQIVICGECGEMFRRLHWNNRGVKSIVWRCISRLESTGLECHARTINELLLQDVVVKAINQMLGDKSSYQAQLQLNIATVIRASQATAIDSIDEKLMALQQELIQKANSKEDYDEIADEIFRLRELRQKTTVDTAARDEQIKRINDLQDYISQQTTYLTEFDESLVRRWIKQITIWDDHITVELKSDVSIDVDA